jgi:hypothetical protein
MKGRLLAAVAALALGGSAFAMDYDLSYGPYGPPVSESLVVGLLGAASQRCDASYDPVGMLNLANSILASLRREGRFSEEEIRSQIATGMGVFSGVAASFDGQAASLDLKFACDRMVPVFAGARAAFNRHHRGEASG